MGDTTIVEETTSQDVVTTLDVEVQEVKADLRKFNKAVDQVNKAVAALETITVTKQEDIPAAMEVLKKAKTVETLIENKRKEMVAPFNTEVKKINAYAKELTEKLPPAIDAGKKVILDWQKAEEARVLKVRSENRISNLVAAGIITVDQEGAIILSHPDSVNVSLKLIDTADDTTWNVLYNDWVETIKQKNAQVLQALQGDKDFAETFGSEEDKKHIDDKIESLQQQPPAPAFTHYAGGSSFNKVKGSTKTWTFEVTDINLVPREYLIVDEIKIRKNVVAGVRDIPGVRIFQKDGLAIR